VTLPDDGATGFPTDGVVRVFLTGFAPSLRAVVAREYRLVDALGAEVPLVATVVGTRLDLRPRAALRPRRRYAVERLYAYDAEGALVDDARRLDARGQGLRRAWFPAVGFETAAAPALRRRPSTVALSETVTEVRFGGGDCGPGLVVATRFALPATTRPTDSVQFEVRARGLAPRVVAVQPADGATRVGAGDLLCTPDPVVIPYRPAMEARVVVLDAAGAVASASPWTAAVGTPRMPIRSGWEASRTRRSGDDPERDRDWAAPPIVTPTAADVRAPSLCPHGFESVARQRVAAEGAPWMYEDQSTLLFDGARGWFALDADRDGAAMTVLGLSAGGAPTSLRTGIPGGAEAGALDASGPLFVSRRFVPPQGATREVHLHALDRDGRTRWSRGLFAMGGDYRVAVGGGRALVTFTRGAGASAPLGWALFDARTGDPVAEDHGGAPAVTADGSSAAAWVDGAFLLAWTSPHTADDRAPRVSVAALSPDGTLATPAELGVRASGPIDLSPVGGRAALVSTARGRVEWTLLDRAGAVLRGPVEVSGGVGGDDHRKARASCRDGLCAVAWESSSTDATWAAAVDLDGAVSPAHALSGQRGSSTVGIAAGPGRSFLASYSVNQGEAWVTSLRCRASAAAGAPGRIGR
jgi:hypothetical protein